MLGVTNKNIRKKIVYRKIDFEHDAHWVTDEIKKNFVEIIIFEVRIFLALPSEKFEK